MATVEQRRTPDTSEGGETLVLCVELRRELERLGVALPALAPLAWCGAASEDGGPSPLIWLGTCDAATGRLLLDVLRGCGA
jgi:hypothetical protein